MPLLSKAPDAGSLFYARLFEIAPEVRPLFKEQTPTQARKLTDMLGLAIRSLRDSATLTGMLEALGRRHGGYGVTAAQYRPVGEALIWTLRQSLKEGFTPDVEAAWTKLYGAVAATMIQAQNSARAA